MVRSTILPSNKDALGSNLGAKKERMMKEQRKKGRSDKRTNEWKKTREK
jgi:hypothetical protein